MYVIVSIRISKCIFKSRSALKKAKLLRKREREGDTKANCAVFLFRDITEEVNLRSYTKQGGYTINLPAVWSPSCTAANQSALITPPPPSVGHIYVSV